MVLEEVGSGWWGRRWWSVTGGGFWLAEVARVGGCVLIYGGGAVLLLAVAEFDGIRVFGFLD